VTPDPTDTATATPTATDTLVPTVTATDTPSATPTPLAGDVNRDGIVNQLDVDLVIQAIFREVEAPGAPADVNADGRVTSGDVAAVVLHLSD